MTRFKDFINMAKYAIYRKSIQRMPYRDQIKAASEMYDFIDEIYKNKTGDNVGVCTVSFQCPYEGHVSYHCNRILAVRKSDENDILSDYVIERQDEDSWRLTVIVATSDENPHIAADAVAMSAVLHIPTVLGEFNRSYRVAENFSCDIQKKEIVCC